MLTDQDIDAINRLLTWRAEATLAGFRVRVELSQVQDRNAFCCVIFDGADRLVVAYEPTPAAAIERALASVGPAVPVERDRERDTLPAPPLAADEGVTPLEQLIA